MNDFLYTNTAHERLIEKFASDVKKKVNDYYDKLDTTIKCAIIDPLLNEYITMDEVNRAGIELIKYGAMNMTLYVGDKCGVQVTDSVASFWDEFRGEHKIIVNKKG